MARIRTDNANRDGFRTNDSTFPLFNIKLIGFVETIIITHTIKENVEMLFTHKTHDILKFLINI